MKTLYCLPSYSYVPEAGTHPSGVFSVASNRADAFNPSDQAFVAACADFVPLVELFIELLTEGADDAPNPELGIGEPGG